MEPLSQEKADVFVKEYRELVEKHKIDFANYPVYIPDGQGGFKTILQSTPVSTEGQPVKSPFVEKE